MTKINELFALPIGLKEVVNAGGIPLYGSQTLNDKFIQSVKISRRGKLISSEIERLVNNKTIIPCFADSNILTYFRRKVSKSRTGGLFRILRYIVAGKEPIAHPLDHVFAFYDFENNKIIVLISNHVTENFSSTASDEAITLSLTHELMHMYAHQNPNKFLSFFRDELVLFYKTYFTEILKLKEDKKIDEIIESIVRFLFLKCEMNSSIPLTALFNKLKELQPYSSLSKEEFKKVIYDYIKVTRYIITVIDMSKFIALVKKDYKYLIVPLYISYKLSFGRIPSKGCHQELVYPSEVICGYSDIKVTPKIKTSIQSLI